MPEAAPFIDVLLGVLTGLGLAAACGFRVFVPLLAVSLAVRMDVLEVRAGFQWMGSTPALVAFSVATLVEVASYFLPWLDNLLDLGATPAAALAGALIAGATMVEVDPWLRWSLSLVAGAGLATAVQLPTAASRLASTGSSGGAANFGISLGELVGAALLSGMAILAPIAVPMVVIAVAVAGLRHVRRRHERRRSGESVAG